MNMKNIIVASLLFVGMGAVAQQATSMMAGMPLKKYEITVSGANGQVVESYQGSVGVFQPATGHRGDGDVVSKFSLANNNAGSQFFYQSGEYGSCDATSAENVFQCATNKSFQVRVVLGSQ